MTSQTNRTDTRPCKFCNPPIEIIPNADPITKKWRPLNVDGTKHNHNIPYSKPEYPRSTQGQMMRQHYPDTASPSTDLEIDDEGYDEKAAAIAAASSSSSTKNVFQERDERITASHQENITAWNAQTAALNAQTEVLRKLSTAIDMLTAAITRQTQRKEMDDITQKYGRRESGWNPEGHHQQREE